MAQSRWFLFAFVAGLLAAPMVLHAQTSTTDWSVAALDEILANVRPGQKTARIDDMEILVRNLRSWRNKLRGEPTPKSAFDGTSPIWPGGNVYYSFSNNVSAAKQKVFLDGAAEWALFANLHFIARSKQANYVFVYEVPTLNGGSSNVGMTGGAQPMLFGANYWNHPTICHEIGHALGLIHEHQRSDRDFYITILTNNVQPGYGGLVKLTNTRNQGPYDFLSVMHYAQGSGAINPDLPTMVPLPPYSQFANVMGQGDPILTPYDRAGMAIIYGSGPALSSVVTNTQDSGLGSLRAALYYGYDHPNTIITFNIPTTDPGLSNGVFNILPTDFLPSLFHGTALDGSSQSTNPNPSGPSILLNGSLDLNPFGGNYALRLRGTNCIVHAIIVNAWPHAGIDIVGTNAIGNVVTGCYLGTDPSGSVAVPVGGVPLVIEQGASGNRIGGLTPRERNIISGSLNQGIDIVGSGTSGNVIEGNFIGLNSTGTAALPNGWQGIAIFGGAQSNVVGGLQPGARNIISGNTEDGVLISDENTTGNIIKGNYIGLDPTGTKGIGNGLRGIRIGGGAQSNIIGGMIEGEGNVISGNSGSGVFLGDSGTSGNSIQGNYVGLDAIGSAAVPNAYYGVEIASGATANMIGDTLPSEHNIISGNKLEGVVIYGTNTVGNVLQGNYIGLNPSGTAALGNGGHGGISIVQGSRSNIIGGTIAGAGNIVSGNGGSGVFLGDSGTSGNVIQGNYCGLDGSGFAAIPNAFYGVEIASGASGNTIGGVGGRNLISGNRNTGIAIYGNSTLANVIQGNTIGLNTSGVTAVPNGASGIILTSGTQSNLIGGLTWGAPNIIADNAAYGIELWEAATSNNTIRANSIFGNSWGISIGLHTGANLSAIPPSLTFAALTTNTTVSGTLSSLANTSFQLDFYSSPASPPQGMTYLGAKSITTGADGSVSFTANLACHVPAGRFITATATDPAGNTSGMSGSATVTATSSVNDGIPNAWRAQYFGDNGAMTNTQSCATCDPDHDGMNNFQEFLAGTNPTDASSVLKLVAQNPNVSGDIADFSSVAGIAYRLEVRDDLSTGFWSILADQVIGTGTNIFLGDPSSTLLPKRFYRAEVLW